MAEQGTKRSDAEAQVREVFGPFKTHATTIARRDHHGNPDKADRLFGMQERIAGSALQFLGRCEPPSVARQGHTTIVGHDREQ